MLRACVGRIVSLGWLSTLTQLYSVHVWDAEESHFLIQLLSTSFISCSLLLLHLWYLFMRHFHPVSKYVFPPRVLCAPFPTLQRLDDGGANVYRLVLCVRMPCVSANLSLLQFTNLLWSVRTPALAALLKAQWSPSYKEIVAHALAVLRSRLPWCCTVHNSCYTRVYISLVVT